MKIDTEGYDLFVLRSFPFDKTQPLAIVCEFEDRKTVPLGYSMIEVGSFLKPLGYRAFVSEWEPFVRYGVQHTWKRLVEFATKEKLGDLAWGNLIAIKSDEFMSAMDWAKLSSS